jgi:hypothetical protein
LASLDCFAIYTVPISLLYDPPKHPPILYHYADVSVHTQEGAPEPPDSPYVAILREIT